MPAQVPADGCAHRAALQFGRLYRQAKSVTGGEDTNEQAVWDRGRIRGRKPNDLTSQHMIYPFERKKILDIYENFVIWMKLSGYDLTRWSNVLFGAGLVGI